MDAWGWTGAESQEEQPWMTGGGAAADGMYSMGQGKWDMPRSMSSLQPNKTIINKN